MHQLILLRHAKAVRGTAEVPDHEVKSEGVVHAKNLMRVR